MTGSPPAHDIIANRLRSNDEWLAVCKNKHREELLRIAEFARQARMKAGLSLREVARRMGVSAAFLSDLERGNRLFTAATIEKWGQAIKKP